MGIKHALQTKSVWRTARARRRWCPARSVRARRVLRIRNKLIIDAFQDFTAGFRVFRGCYPPASSAGQSSRPQAPQAPLEFSDNWCHRAPCQPRISRIYNESLIMHLICTLFERCDPQRLGPEIPTCWKLVSNTQFQRTRLLQSACR